MHNLVKEAFEKRGFDVVALNYRGLLDCPLTTPRFYNLETIDDVQEPIEYFYDKYCKNTGKKIMALGCSMGANLLANAIGDDGESCKLTAAVCMQAPMKSWVVADNLPKILNGAYDRALAQSMTNVVLKHGDLL